MSPSSTAACVAVCLLVTACGSRSDLSSPPSGSGGAPSHAITVSSGAGAAVGAGGAPPAVCNRLQQREVRSFDSLDGYVAHTPQLTFTNLEGTQATLVVRSQTEQLPNNGTPLLTQVTFQPWLDWTAASLGAERRIAEAIDFVVPRTRELGLSVWYAHTGQPAGVGSSLVRAASPFQDDPESIQVLSLSVQPLFVTGLVGTETGFGYSVIYDGGSQDTVYGGFTDTAPYVYPEGPCATPRGQMDGIRFGDSYLVAIAIPIPEQNCAMGDTVALLRYANNQPPMQTHVVAGAVLVARVWLTPRGDGAWLAWHHAGLDGPGSIMAQPIDADGEAARGAFEMASVNTAVEATAVSPFGNGIALAHFDPEVGVSVSAFDEYGTQVLGAVISAPAPPRLDEPLALLGSPDGRSLLLAWGAEELDTTLSELSHAYVTRLDCVP